jgi:hypothetical protein
MSGLYGHAMDPRSITCFLPKVPKKPPRGFFSLRGGAPQLASVSVGALFYASQVG